MAQIKSGTAAVTNGSNIVTAAAGVDWSAATAMSYFSIDGVRGAPVYAINSRAFVSGAWRLTLATNYGETSNPTAAYLIQKDFLTFSIDGADFSIPIFGPGDTQTLELWNRGVAVIIAALTAVRDRASIRLWNPDQNLFFTLSVKGAAGAEVIHLSDTGSP